MTGLTLWKPDGTVIYANPKCSFVIASVYSESLVGSVALPQIANRMAFVVTRGRAWRNLLSSFGAVANEEQHVKILNNTLTWNIPNTTPQQIGGLYAPFTTVNLRFFVIIK